MFRPSCTAAKFSGTIGKPFTSKAPVSAGALLCLVPMFVGQSDVEKMGFLC